MSSVIIVNNWRRFVQALLPLAVVLTVASCSNGRPQPGQLRYVTIDLGQADCHLLQTSSAAVLIDTGETDSASAIIRNLKHYGVDSIDLLIISHPHADHLGGAKELLERFSVRRVMDSGYPSDTVLEDRFRRTVQQKKIPYRRARAGQIIQVGDDLQVSVLWPPDTFLTGTDSDVNNSSVVIRAKYGKTVMLMAADLQSEAEHFLVRSGMDLHADLLKVGHQGSKDATSDVFLGQVSPSIAVISVGKGNPYGHPHRETLEKLRNGGAVIYRTDVDGTLEFVSDGKTLKRVSR